MSKVIIVARSEREGVIIAHTFGQVTIDEPVVDYSGNGGTLTYANGGFGVDEWLVRVDVEEGRSISVVQHEHDYHSLATGAGLGWPIGGYQLLRDSRRGPGTGPELSPNFTVRPARCPVSCFRADHWRQTSKVTVKLSR